eukprot:COSAG05_NODE_1642_length_4354_cov_27.365687_1_plen_69_part_10
MPASSIRINTAPITEVQTASTLLSHTLSVYLSDFLTLPPSLAFSLSLSHSLSLFLTLSVNLRGSVTHTH